MRRIEAVTSKEAFEFLEQRNNLFETAAEMKVVQLKKVPRKVEALQAQIKELEQQNKHLKLSLQVNKHKISLKMLLKSMIIL